MSLNCSFNIKTEDITNIIGKDTFKNLTQEECESTITQLMSSYGLTQEDLLDNKYKSDIIAAIKRNREEASKAALANIETNNSEKVAESQEALDILKKEGITLDNSLIDKYLLEVKASNPYHQIFKQIVGILNNNNIPINIVVNSNLSNIAARKQDGFKTATIEINPALLLDYLMTDNKDNIKENLMKILTHELVHAVTAEILNYHPSWAKIKNFNEAQTEFSNNVWNLYLQCKEQLKGTKWYGLTNAKEFIAVALTDRDFQIELSKIKLDKNENAFKRFINYLTDLFNKVFKAQGIDIKNSALEEIISISQEYFNSANKNLRGGIYDYTGTRDYYDNAEAGKNIIKESVYSKQLIKVLQSLIDKIKDSNIKEAKAAQNLYEWTIKAQQAVLDAIEKGERKDDDLLLDKVQEQLNNLIQKTPENLAKDAIKAAKEMGKDWGKNTEQKASRNYSNNKSFTWDVTSDNSYEVSTLASKNEMSKQEGDARFSALNAKFKKGTIIDGVDVGGMSIEDVYQKIIKKSGKGKAPAKTSRLYNEALKTKKEREDFSYYEAYLPLWQEWARQNPELIEELRENARGKTLTDKYAYNTTVSQARALADILNNSTKGVKKNTTSVTKIISGGQTGVDTIGLQVAKELGIETGGTAPKGFLREEGYDDEDIASYGLEEITDEEQEDYTKRTDKKDPYTGRTELNVRNSDGTVYFNVGSDTAGLIATRRSAKEWNKPFIENPTAEELRQWIKDNNIKTLNVAGNRGSKLSKNNKVAETIREALTGKTTTTEQETKKKSSKSLKETIESAQAKRPTFDSIEVGKIQKRLLSIYFPNVTERIAATDFITNYFSLILDNTVSDFKESLNANEEDYRDSLGDEEYERVYKGLFRGTPAQQRIFALSLSLGGKALPLQIFDRIKNLIDSFIETEDIHELVYDWYLNEDNSIKLESFLGNEFSWEAAQNGWDTPKKIEENAILRVRALKSYFTNHFKDDRVFDALVKEAAFDIEFNEGIRLDTRGNVMETNQEAEDKENDVESEAENPNKEGYMIKYKLLDPIDTISVKLKNKLAHLYKMNFNLNRKNDVEYVFNPLGFRVKLNPMIAYYTILNEFQSISSEDELNEMFEDAVTKYPWLQSLKDNVVFNPLVPQEFDLDFRKEFFRACKSFAPFAMVTDKGTIAYLNRDNQSSTFLDMVRTTYEGHNVLGEHSIFNEDGTRNSGNVDRLFKLLTKGLKGTKDDINSHPLFLVKRILGNSKSSIYDLFTALQILRGEHPRYSGISLEKMLRNLGIETANMNLEALLPATFALELEADGSVTGTKESPEFTAEFIEEAEDNNMNPVDYFNSLFTPKMKRYLATILEKATVITRPVQGYQDGDDLVTKFQNAYLSIGNALTMANEAYSQTSFRFAGNNRFSYVAYDMITRMSNLLSKVKTVEAQERGTKYLIDNYGQYDFFRNQETGEWYNTWLQQWFEKDEHGEYTIRENFKILNMLGFGGNEEKNSFGKVTSDALIDNHILAFLNGNKDKYGNTYGYYRNALFSDTDASVLIKHIRYVGDNYKEVIINNLAKVLRQEFERIISLLKSNEEKDTVQIEFFNKNGTKFNFFPALNNRRVELLKKYVELSKLSSTEFKEQSDVLLTNLVTDIIEGEKDPVTGLRSGGKLQEFLNSIDETRRKTLYTKIKKVNATKEKEETQGEEDDERSSKIDFGENEETKESKEESSEEKNRELDEILTNFFYNDYFAQSQIIQIFGGDLAYYKNFRDFIKRNKQAYAAGDRLYGMLMDEQGNNIEPLMETSIYLKDKIEVSNSYESIKHMLNSAVGVSKLSKEMILGALSGYRNITATDGQSFRTPKAIKKILQAMGGKWTDDMEEAFNRMTVQRKFDSKDFFTIWNNIKPFLYSHETVQVGDRKEKVITQHKNSEYMMTAMYDMIGMALSKSPQLRALQEFMEDNDIDVAHFNSVVKEGFFSGVNINYDKKKFEAKKGKNDYIEVAGHQIKADTYEDFIENLANALDEEEISQLDYNNIIKEIDFDKSEKGVKDCYKQLSNAIFMKDENGEIVLDEKGNYMIDPIKVHKFPLSDYMVVQPSGDHLTEDDLMAIFGSQLRNIIPADLPENFSTTINLGGTKKTLNREEYIKLYNTLIVDQLLDSFARVNDEFSSVEKLQSALLAKIHGNPKYGSDVEEALQLETDEYGNKRFKIPFNNPNLNNKIEELLLSTFKNAIQKQKINGGNIILVSNFGLSDDLQIHYKEDEDGNESIDYIDCYMPAYKRSLIQDFLVKKEYGDTGEEYWEIDYDKIKGNEDLLEMIGYRIPTENKYSIFKMRIKGFLPISAGTAIMLPSDIVNMSGTDFDIDKLFLMLKSFRREVTDSSFTRAFDSYLAKRVLDNKGENTKETDEGFKVLDKLQKVEGLTQEELDKYIDESTVFEDFMYDEGFELKLKTPNYRSFKPKVTKGMSIEDISEQKDIKKARERKLTRDNMLIDMISACLTSNAGSQMSVIPGSYVNVKHTSREQRILKDPKALAAFKAEHKEEIEKTEGGILAVLHKYSLDSLEKFYDTKATIEDPLSIIDYAKNHRNLMDGNDLIGMFAVNSSSHYKFQFIREGKGLHIQSDSQFNIKLLGKPEVKVTTIDAVVSPLTGDKIGDYCAEYQAASPDNGKDPCLGDLNANGKTVSRIGFLTRIGCDPETVGILNTCDDFLNVIGSIVLDKRNGYLDDFDNWRDFHGDISKITDMIVEYRLNGLENINMSEAAQFLGWMNNISDLSQLLQESSVISRCDSPNGALAISTAEAAQQLFKAEDFMQKVTKRKDGKLIANPSSPIQGFETFIDTDLNAVDDEKNIRKKILESSVPRVQAAYTLGIRSAYTLASKYNMLPQLSKGVENAIGYLRSITKSNLSTKNDVKELRQFFNELVMYLLSDKDSRFGSNNGEDIMDKRNYYIHDFPIKYNMFLNKKDKHGKFVHQDVRDKTIIQCIRVSKTTGITFQNVSKVSNKSRKYFSEELEQLLTSDNPEVVEFAEDLFNYAYYANGFNFGPSNFGIFFTNAFYENMPNYLNVLKSKNNKLASIPAMDSFLQNFVYQFIMNNPKYAARLRKARTYFTFNYDADTKETTMTFKSGLNNEVKSAGLKAVSANDNIITVPFIVIQDANYGGLYYRTSKETDANPTFTKVYFNGLPTPFYDSSKNLVEDINAIDYSKMKDYGDPSNVNKVLEIMKKDKPQLINKTSTVGEVEDAVKQNEVDDASVNADAIAASSEDNIVQPDDLESGIQEPENFDDLEAGIQEPKDWKDMVNKYVQETADKLDALQKEQEKMKQKLDDLISPPTEPENTLCEK